MIPFNGADPGNIVAAFGRDLSSDQIISLLLRCDARSSNPDPWQLLQQVLSRPEVYEAFGISSLPKHAQFDVAHGLEVIGTVANLLACGWIRHRFVENFEEALAESRRFLDVFVRRDYRGARAYSCQVGWCDWFIGDGMLDATILVNHGTDWWLLAVTGTD